MIGVPVVTCLPVVSSVNTTDMIFTASGSLRWVVKRDWPGRRLSRWAWMSAASSGMRGGQPSTTQPIAAPWLSPKLVNRKRWPNVLNDMGVPLVAGVVTRSLAAVKSGVARESLALENVNHPLRNIEQRRGGRLGDAEMGDQPARGTAMGGDHRVGRQALVPLSDARRHHLVALAARRHEMPFVVLALSDVLRVAHVQLRDGKALPFAEGDFREPRLPPVTVDAKSERRARQFHGLAGARERARYIIESGGIVAGSRKQVAQDVRATCRVGGD